MWRCSRVIFISMNYTTHSFSVELAAKVGLEEALLLQHFYYWHQTNRENPDMVKDGRVWSYSSRKNILSVFPYLTDKKIRNTIDSLIGGGYLIKGEYAKDFTHKASWYSLTDSGRSLFENEEELPDGGSKRANTLAERANPLDERANVYNNNNNNIKKDIILKDNIERKLTDEEIIQAKRDSLRKACEPYVDKYGQKMIDDFVFYWGEASGKNLKWEISKKKSGCFEISRRLATWANNNRNSGSNPTPRTAAAPLPKKKIWEEMGVTEEYYRTVILKK